MLDRLRLEKDSSGTPSGGDLRRASPGVWLALMAADGLLVVFFGALAATRIISHRAAPPAAAAVNPQKKRKVRTAEAPAKPTLEARAAPRPAPSPAPKMTDSPKVPSSIVEPFKTALAQDAPGPAKLAAAGGKARAVPVTFKLHSPDAKRVQLAGAFLVHDGAKDMVGSGGDWTLTIYLNPGDYRYTFLIDGKRTLDLEDSCAGRNSHPPQTKVSAIADQSCDLVVWSKD